MFVYNSVYSVEEPFEDASESRESEPFQESIQLPSYGGSCVQGSFLLGTAEALVASAIKIFDFTDLIIAGGEAPISTSQLCRTIWWPQDACDHARCLCNCYSCIRYASTIGVGMSALLCTSAAIGACYAKRCDQREFRDI